jgi:hypothetical protein
MAGKVLNINGCSPLQLLCSLTENRPQSLTAATLNRWQQGYRMPRLERVNIFEKNVKNNNWLI